MRLKALIATSLLAGSFSISVAGAASAATVVRISDTRPIGPIHYDPDPFFPCSPGGVSTGTVRSNIVMVDTGEGGTFHVTYHENFTFVAVPDDPAFPTLFDRGSETSTFTATKGGTTVITATNHDTARGTNGEWVRVRGLYHLTVRDLEPLGPSENDEIRTEFDHFSFTCSFAEGVSS
jgi:hypothetical protein